MPSQEKIKDVKKKVTKKKKNEKVRKERNQERNDIYQDEEPKRTNT